MEPVTIEYIRTLESKLILVKFTHCYTMFRCTNHFKRMIRREFRDMVGWVSGFNAGGPNVGPYVMLSPAWATLRAPNFYIHLADITAPVRVLAESPKAVGVDRW